LFCCYGFDSAGRALINHDRDAASLAMEIEQLDHNPISYRLFYSDAS